MPEPITLSAIAPERQIVRIETAKDVFEEYDMALADDLSLTQRRDLSNSWMRLNQLEEKKDLTKSDDAEFDRLSKRIVKLVLPTLPTELNNDMPRGTREGIIIAFFGNPSDPRMRVMMQMLMNQANLTGDSTSPDSNDSTEETLSDGSTSPLESSVST